MKSTGIGSPLTGQTVYLLLIDYPIKNDEEANSKTIRDKHWNWWQTTALPRLSKTGVAIVIMTRWHSDDLVGRIQAQQKAGGFDEDVKKWHFIELKALEEEEDILGREIGQCLCPDQHPQKHVEAVKQSIHPSKCESLYQQNTTSYQGDTFEAVWKHYFGEREHWYELVDAKHIVKEDCTIIQIYYLATSTQ